jgi:hypothetical protein
VFLPDVTSKLEVSANSEESTGSNSPSKAKTARV